MQDYGYRTRESYLRVFQLQGADPAHAPRLYHPVLFDHSRLDPVDIAKDRS